MGYKRAEQILPPEILAQIQEYVDGECIYIPRKVSSELFLKKNEETTKRSIRNDAVFSCCRKVLWNSCSMKKQLHGGYVLARGETCRLREPRMRLQSLRRKVHVKHALFYLIKKQWNQTARCVKM